MVDMAEDHEKFQQVHNGSNSQASGQAGSTFVPIASSGGAGPNDVEGGSANRNRTTSGNATSGLAASVAASVPIGGSGSSGNAGNGGTNNGGR